LRLVPDVLSHGAEASGFRGEVWTWARGVTVMGRVKTDAPEGHPPLLPACQTRDPLAVMGGVTPAGRIDVLVRRTALNGRHTIELLRHLIRHIGGRLLVIGDGSPIHRRAEVSDFLAGAEGRGVQVERLPPYAPDLNPVEGAWQQLKHVELRTMVFLDLADLHLELHLAIGRLRQKPRLIRSVFEGAGLPIETFPSFCNAQ
jgi:transposase